MYLSLATVTLLAQYGDANARRVLDDIFGVSKLYWRGYTTRGHIDAVS